MRYFSVVAFLGGCLLVATVMAGADQGKAIFQKKMCAACHGPGKVGIDLKDSKRDKAALMKCLKDPKSAKPNSPMPAFNGSDADLSALADYLLSLRKK